MMTTVGGMNLTTMSIEIAMATCIAMVQTAKEDIVGGRVITVAQRGRIQCMEIQSQGRDGQGLTEEKGRLRR